MGSYLSYAAQAGHYFSRPHQEPVRTPLDVPAAWRGADLAGGDEWRTTITPSQLTEIRNALKHALATGKPTGELDAGDFPLPTLAATIQHWRDEVSAGRGFQLVSGVPIDEWSAIEAETFFWCMGLHMGRPGAQNPQGDLLGHVHDTGDDADDPFVRLYRTSGHIAYHCDAADVVGLLCLRTAKRGGVSRIVSSVSVYNQLLAERPDLIDRLYEPFQLDVRNEDRSGALRTIPIPPCRYSEGVLRTFYHSDYFRSVTRHEDVAPFTHEERELLDLYEEIALRPDLYLEMNLEPGDIQWVSNHSVLHSRTAYEDVAAPSQDDAGRHLLRLWLSIE